MNLIRKILPLRSLEKETKEKARFIVIELVHKLEIESEYNTIFRDYEANVLKKQALIR